MTPEELAALEAIERQLKMPGYYQPKAGAEVGWLVALVRKLDVAIPGKPRKRSRRAEFEIEMSKQAARIAELEGMLGLTPEVVFAAERKRIAESGELP